MAECQFCRRDFANAQAVRAHLKSCPDYQRAPREPRQPKGSLGSGSDAPALDAGARAEPAVRQARAHVELAEADLRIRQLGESHRRLDDEQEARARRRREEADVAAQQAAAEAGAREKARLEAEERRQREAAAAEARRRQEETERQRAERQRALITRAKSTIEATPWLPGTFKPVPADVRAVMIVEVDKTLRGLPALDELQLWEIDRIAEGVVEKHLRPLAQEHERRAEQQRRREEVKRARVERGKLHAERQLQRAGVASWDHQSLMREVQAALERASADDDQEDVESIVTNVLEPKLRELAVARKGAEERTRAARKQQLVDHGASYGYSVLVRTEDLQPADRPGIASKIRRALEAELEGDESPTEVEELVEDLLADEGVEPIE